jgi:glycosyltransferase involved in cell wall biosynthesis
MPYPPNDGGAVATLSMIQGFVNKGDKVVVLSMQTHKHKTKLADLPDHLTQNVEWYQQWINTRINPFNLLINLLFSRTPYNAQRFNSNAFRQQLIQVLQKNRFDVIQLEGLYLAPYIDAIKAHSNAPIALRAHNLEHEIWERLAVNSTQLLKKWYLALLAKRVKKMEFETLKKIDLLIPITQRDAFKLNPNENLAQFVCPTGISPLKIEETLPEFHQSLFYIGALDWEPNQAGILWFLEYVWQDLSKKFPQWQFVLAGRNAPQSFVKQVHKYRLSYLGEVDNAEAFIDAHNLMVVPLFSGSGMRIKIIEGMARAKCIVTTSIGAEGILAKPDSDLLIADDANTFKKHIELLLTNTDRIAQIGKNACSFVRNEFDNEQLIEGLRKFYQSKIES